MKASRDTAVKVIPPTQWKSGLLIGGAIGTVGLGFFAYALCHDLRKTRENCLGPALGGGVLGGS